MASKNDLVVKSNRLVEASYRLTLAEQRIILYAVVEARRTGRGLNADDFVDIVAADYAAMFGVPLKQAYEQIKEAGKTLFRRYVVLHDTHPESGKPRVTEVRWLSAASYIDGAGTIQLRFAPDMVPFITRLEAQFTRYKLEKVASMSSVHAIRLYELLMQWGSVGRREIELEWLRKALNLEEEYQSIKNFKKRVIDVALSQINEHSDLTARYEQRKTGRTVTHFIFTFAPKEEAPPPEAPQAPADARESPAFLRLRGLGLPARLAAAWARQDEARALAAAEYVEAKVARGEVKGRAAGYLRAVFESGAEIGPSAFEADAQARAAAAAESKRQAEAQRRERDRAEREALERARAALQALPAAERLALAESYRRGPGAERSASWDEAGGDFRDPLERIGFNLWLQARFKGGAAA